MIIQIIRNFDDYEDVSLGYIFFNGEDIGEVEDIISKSWDEFCESESECDADFIDFLVNKDSRFDYKNNMPMIYDIVVG